MPVPEQKQTVAPIRPLQAEFRERLMEAYGECCAISGCRVPEVLDAAHLRSWREGSGVGDGILLRKDLHALLDAGLLTISRDYVVSVPPRARVRLRELRRRETVPPQAAAGLAPYSVTGSIPIVISAANPERRQCSGEQS